MRLVEEGAEEGVLVIVEVLGVKVAGGRVGEQWEGFCDIGEGRAAKGGLAAGFVKAAEAEVVEEG